MGDVKTTKDLKYQMFLHSVRLSVVNIPNGWQLNCLYFF